MYFCMLNLASVSSSLLEVRGGASYFLLDKPSCFVQISLITLEAKAVYG